MRLGTLTIRDDRVATAARLRPITVPGLDPARGFPG